jgi:S1-C subfamily serine protease
MGWEVIKMFRTISFAAALALMLSLNSHAMAQSELDASVVPPLPGEPRSFPGDLDPTVDKSGADIGSAIAAGSAFLKEYKTNERTLRGVRNITIFRDAAPAVVLVVTNDGIGSGSLLENGAILTNWHVVSGNRQVNVIFKPIGPLGKLSTEDMIAADVVKVDRTRDLALLQPRGLAARLIKRIRIASDDNLEIGADVHAIGHPTGEAWTYTAGIVSQIRSDYEWSGGPKDVKHRATVIQTQTPINPGNSGGPLLADDGQLVGVNAFRTSGAEGLNFAISAKDVRSFLAAPVAQTVPEDDCKPRVLFEGRNKDNTAFIRTMSLKCDDRADVTVVVPDDKQKPVMALVDISRRNKVEGVVLDERRAGKWNTSFWDPKLEETFPLRGLHPDGAFMPTSMEPRCRAPSKPMKNFKCS